MADIKINVQVVESQARAAVAGLEKQTKATDSAFKALNLSIKQTTGATAVFLGNLASKAVTEVISSIKALAVGSVDLAGQLETAATKFEVLTGSAGSANKLLKELQTFSASTPFQFNEITDAASKLLAFGVEADKVESKLQSLGDVAAASGSSINEVSLIFGQVAAAGKLTGERLLQFQERAIPIGPALAKTMGVAESSIKDLVSKGKVDFATFEKAFDSLSQKGGAAFGGMSKLSQTFAGRVSTLKDNFAIFQQTIGAKLLPAMKAIVTTVTTVIGQFTKMISTSDGLGDASSYLVDTFVAVVKAGTFVYNTVQGLRFVVTELGSVFFAFGAKVLSVYESVLSGANKLSSALGIRIPGLEDAVAELGSLRDAFSGTASDLQESADSIGTNMAQAAMMADSLGATLQKNLAIEVAAANESANAVDKSTKKKAESIQALSDAEIAAQQKKLDDQIKFDEAFLAQQQASEQANYEAVLLADGELSAHDELLLLEEADRQARQLEQQQIFNATKQIQQDEALGVAEETLNQHKNNLALIEEKSNADSIKRQNAISKKMIAIKDAEKKLEETRRNQVLGDTANMFGALATLASTGGEKLFKITQAFNYAEALVAGYLSIQKAAAALPYPANIPGIVASTAMAAANLIKIKQASPKFAEGGIVPGNSFSGDKVAARLNSGEMVLNKSQQATLFNMANGSGGGGGQVIQVNNVIELDGEVVARSVSRQVANGLKLGEVV